MSTSDAGELELRVVGGERATPLDGTARAARSTSTRQHQNERFSERYKQENHHDDETPKEQHRHRSAIRQEETHKAGILRADRLSRLRKDEEASHRGDSDVHTQKTVGSRFTSCLYLSLSCDSGLHKPELTHRHSLIEPLQVKAKDSSFQVNGGTSSPDTSIETAGLHTLLKTLPFPTRKEEDVLAAGCNELETTKDLGITPNFSNGDFEPHEPNGLHILSSGSQLRTCTESRTGVQLEEGIKVHKKSQNRTDLGELSEPSLTMLSSSMVTVLAPPWSGRLRRTKRFEGTGNPEAMGNSQGVVNTVPISERGFQETHNQQFVEGAQLRAPFLGPRRNTVGWSTKSDPSSLDYDSKRKITQTVSLDVNSGRVDNRNIGASALSPLATTASPRSPLFLDPNEQMRNPQTGHQGGLSSLGSKPITSSLLLSLRRINSQGRNSNAASTFSEENSGSLSSSLNDRNGLFTTHLSQSFLNNNEQERQKPRLSPSSISSRTTESRPALSPSSSVHRERNLSDTLFFPTSPVNRDAEDISLTQTINMTQSNFTSSKQAFLSEGPSEGKQNCKGSDKSTTLLSETSVSSPRQSPYDSSTLLKNNSLPRRTTLKSTSWWKQVTKEVGSPLTFSDVTIAKNEPNTPSNRNTNMVSPSLTDEKRLGSLIPNNRDNNNTTESVCKGNMNLLMKTQGVTHNLKQRSAENLPDQESHRLVQQQYCSNVNKRQPQKPLGVPEVLSSSKISRATEQTTLSHLKDPSKLDVGNTANVSELPRTLLNPKSSNTPTESSSQYRNSHRPPKTNSAPTSPHNTDSQRFTKTSLSLDFPTTFNSQALTSQTTSCGHPAPNTKRSVSLYSRPVSSQTSVDGSSYTGSTPKFTNNANDTPLGFKRIYASIPKPFQPKMGSSLIPTVNSFSKTNYSPVSTTFPTSSSTTGSHPIATAAPRQCLLSPAVTPANTSFSTSMTMSTLLTPPPTPIFTSPNSETSSPKGERTFSKSPERDPKKKVRRVTWEDSVDLQNPEPITVEKPDPSPVPANPVSPSRFQRSTPAIFSFLRSGSPTRSTSPLCSPTPKTSLIQVGKGGKYRSLSSDSADLASREREQNKQRTSNAMISDQGRQDLTTSRQERTLSVESGTVQRCSSAPLSLPPDFSSGYKLRYSTPPYSTLMSSRLAQGDTVTITPRSPLFSQPDPSNYTPSPCKPPITPIRTSQPLSLPFSNRTAQKESSKCVISETDQINNNHKNSSQDQQDQKILLVDNRFHISTQSLQGEKAHSSSSTFVTETLVYSIKSKGDRATVAPKNTTPKPLAHIANTPVSVESKLSQQSQTVQREEAASEPRSHSDQSSSGSSSTESHSRGDESCRRRGKESVLGKSRFSSVEVNNEQSPKRSRFALKKSVSTPNSCLSTSESERTNKSNNKMDQVFNKLRQKFSTRRTEEDSSFPWKWKRASQTPSISGSSDVSDVSSERTKTRKERGQEKGMLLDDNKKETEAINRWTQSRYTIIPSTAVGSTTAGDPFTICSPTLETDLNEQKACPEHPSENKVHVHLTVHSPTTHQFDFYENNGTDYTATNQFLSYRDPSPSRSPNPSAVYPNQLWKSTPSPRSPFSPFASLSPLSPFSSPDGTDDSVFYSPKLQRRRESSSPCEQGEGFSLGSSRRSRASTGPPSVGPGQDKEHLASSYADLKYGIEPGRSFSVSSVLSSRPSGPGRISTGSRFMSVGDLSQPALSCGSNGRDLDQWSVTSDWSAGFDCQPTKGSQMSYFPSDPDKMRSRSLPRSLTRCLTNWSSGVSPPQPVTATTSKPARLQSPNMNICHFEWDTEGPPTPPPTPPLSPVSRPMSRPPSLSSSTFPSSSGTLQQVDSQSSRGHLPSRGYVSSLSTFEESSDSSSDTTTDDEYYLEADEDREKETEL